jgi:hypothetical protein
MKFVAFFSIILIGCSLPKVNSKSQPIRHEALTSILQKHVNLDGRVNYAQLQQDSLALNSYLALLESHHPNGSWSSDEQKAYWINAYNAFTLRLIIRNYPVKSIKELGGAIYKVNTPWDIRFIYIEGYDYDLNNIEHDILRKQWNDPRIHFAINCASISCPILSNKAYEAKTLDEQLDDAARLFINDTDRNRIAPNEASLSKIFKWFNGDFTKEQSLIAFINRYSNLRIEDKATITFLDYDWGLNE